MEKYPDNWVRLELMIDPETKAIHIISGDREKGEGDQPYIGFKILKSMFCTRDSENECDKKCAKELGITDDPSDVGC